MALFPIDESMPDDVRLLHQVLTSADGQPATFNLQNCGTAMRFLTAWFAQREGQEVILDGTARMRERPIAQEVDALRQAGAEIEYLGKTGFPPLRIHGKRLQRQSVTIRQPQSTQFVSALLLIGIDVQTDCQSPYIQMTRALCQAVASKRPVIVERDWSAAAFWYEYVALYGGELFLEGLSQDSLQGDKVVADLFARLGVETQYETNGVRIRQHHKPALSALAVDFSACPDLYPALYATCFRLGVKMQFSGLDSLPLKESNRLQAMEQLRNKHLTFNHKLLSYADHRIAMALVVAGCEVDDTECISKSYPQFMLQWKKLRS